VRVSLRRGTMQENISGPPAQRGRSMTSPTRPAPALTIDALGRKCPIPIIMLAERIREIPIGATIAVLADDPAARPDIPAWCMMKSQEFVTEMALPRGWAFVIKRTY
jgi:tRNA 2-thiouridine synthesizing protein A